MAESYLKTSGLAVAFALTGLLSSSTPSLALLNWFGGSNDEIAGRAIVVDGDTIDVDGRRVRLEGIDAPELSQTCTKQGGGTWACGRAAANALDDLVRGTGLVCKSEGKDKYGRTLGLCARDGLDLNGEMVRRGLAWAFVKYTKTYVGVEAEARKAHAGIWQADTQTAWDYRSARWQTAETAAPDGCAIKGNISGNGRIYHMPWNTWYPKVKVDAALGEKWFCDEAAAVAAGWRPAKGD